MAGNKEGKGETEKYLFSKFLFLAFFFLLLRVDKCAFGNSERKEKMEKEERKKVGVWGKKEEGKRIWLETTRSRLYKV